MRPDRCARPGRASATKHPSERAFGAERQRDVHTEWIATSPPDELMCGRMILAADPALMSQVSEPSVVKTVRSKTLAGQLSPLRLSTLRLY
jgi:hypothetical protein